MRPIFRMTYSSQTLSVSGVPVPQGLYDYYGHTIGVAWGDLNQDGRWDLVSSNLAHPRFFDFSDKTEILIQQEDGSFQDLQGNDILGSLTRMISGTAEAT